MKVTVTAAIRHLCPYKDEVDVGEAVVTFDVGEEDAPELHEVAASLAWYADQRMSHEEVTRRIANGVGVERVVTRWRTAGLDVVVDTE